MSNKGNKRHIKRLASSKYMKMARKTAKYVSKPLAGRHYGDSSIALVTVIREKLGMTRSIRESRGIIKKGNVEINGKIVKEEKHPVGFGDILHFVPINEYYRVTVGKEGTFQAEKIEKNHDKRLLKVIGKYIAKGGNTMIRLHDGSTITGDKTIKVNDSITIVKGKIGKTVQLEKGRKCLVFKGTHASESGVIKDVMSGSALRDATVKIESGDGSFETLLDNIIVLDE